MTAMPSAEVGPNGFPTIQMMDGNVPPALGMPNDSVQRILQAEKSGPQTRYTGDVFQQEWIEACKGKDASAVHGTSTKTHCDFDYSGSMIEQMLLGLIAHRAGRRLEYDPVAGKVTNFDEANEWLTRKYRPNWTLNG